MNNNFLIIGCNSYVAAIDTNNGEEIWRTVVEPGLFGGGKTSDVCVLIDGDKVYAGCRGKLHCLNAATGELLWSNKLKGMGYNEVSLAIQGVSTQYITRVETRTNSSSE